MTKRTVTPHLQLRLEDPTSFAGLYLWFRRYASLYEAPPAAQIDWYREKREHTLEVVRLMRAIAAGEALTPRLAAICELAALLHDVARFEQYRRFETFNDRSSCNHGTLGVLLVKKMQLLTGLDPADQAIILQAISFHNRRVLPSGLRGEALLVTNLLRDADKIDIWRVHAELLQLHKGDFAQVIGMMPNPGNNYSPDVLSAFLNYETIPYSNMLGCEDYQLLEVAWLSQLNSPSSLAIALASPGLRTLVSSLPAWPETELVLARLAADGYRPSSI